MKIYVCELKDLRSPFYINEDEWSLGTDLRPTIFVRKQQIKGEKIMRVRLDVILEFDNCDNDNIDEIMEDVRNNLYNVAINVETINEEIID